MRKVVTGEQVDQIYNPDPFARPVWRAPVYQTPPAVVAVVQLWRGRGGRGPAQRRGRRRYNSDPRLRTPSRFGGGRA